MPTTTQGAGAPATGLGSISGRYFCDENGNALEDPGEAGAEGIRVRLRDQNTREIIATTFTDANGNYSFDGLEAGRYQVRFDGIADKPFVEANVGNDDAIDSDVVKTFSNGIGRTNSITLGQGENVTDVDAGVEGAAPLPGSISGTYFCDENGNAVRDGGDTPVAGVLVMLLDAGGNATGDQVFTDANGNYSFTGLAAGTYGVKFTDPNNVLDGKELVAANQGGDDSVDSDAIGDTTESTISGITVVGGQDNPTMTRAQAPLRQGLGPFRGGISVMRTATRWRIRAKPVRKAFASVCAIKIPERLLRPPLPMPMATTALMGSKLAVIRSVSMASPTSLLSRPMLATMMRSTAMW